MNHLGLFAKFWQPGTVKTRLARSIGSADACELYRSFVFHLLSRLGDSADQRTVVFSPVSCTSDFEQSIPANWKLCPQVEGDLGVRMRAFFCDSFDKSPVDTRSRKTVVIGADCPQLTRETIQQAFELLDEAPVVIGPSTDGGYYLIAMRDRCTNLFNDIPWSTATVLEDTVEQLRQLGIEYRLLPRLTDVDDLESLLDLESELQRRAIDSRLDELDQRLLAAVQLATETASREADHDN